MAALMLFALLQGIPSITEASSADESVPLELTSIAPPYHLASEDEVARLQAHALSGLAASASGGEGRGISVPGPEEWRSLVGQLKLADQDALASSDVPSSVDLSVEPYFPKVGSQGSQGSCAAWAVTYYAYGYLEAKDRGWTDAKQGNPEHLMSPAWTYNKVNNNSDDGSWPYDNAEVIGILGCATLSTMPYDAGDDLGWGSTQAWREAPLHKGRDWFAMDFDPNTTVPAIRSLLAQGIPVVFCIDAWGLDPWGYFADGDFVISAEDYDGIGMDHAQCIVGYDEMQGDDGDMGAFKVVNSWGVSSADKGYYWITYEAFNEIANYTFVTYLTDEPGYSPSMLAVIQSEHVCRNVTLEVGIGEPQDNNSIRFDFTSTGGPALGESVPRQQTVPYASSLMFLDVSRFREANLAGEHRFFLIVDNPSGQGGSIQGFGIELYEGAYVPGRPSCVSRGMDTPGQDVPPWGRAVANCTFAPYPCRSLDQALDVDWGVSSGGSCAWTAQPHASKTGGYAARSGTVDANEAAWMSAQLVGPGLLSFHWMVSSEPRRSDADRGDRLCAYVDGILVEETNGSRGWALVEIAIGTGPSEVRWSYEKDADGADGEDAAWVDAAMLTPATVLEDNGFEVVPSLAWSAGDLNPDSGEDCWGISQFRPVPLAGGGNACLWCAQAGLCLDNGLPNPENHRYDSGMAAYYMAALPDLSAYDQVWVDFDYYSRTSSAQDLLALEAYDGAAWYGIWSQPGNAGEWRRGHQALAPDSIALRFLFRSSNHTSWAGPEEGAYLDNVQVLAYASAPNPNLAPPTPPTNLTATAGLVSVALAWSEPAYSNASVVRSYLISFQAGSGPVLTALTDQTSFLAQGLAKGQSYGFRICALNDAGWGLNCSPVTAIPLGLPDAPQDPRSQVGDGHAVLSWSPPAYLGPGQVDYRAFRDGSLVWTGPGLSFSEDGLNNGQQYIYAISASNSLGWGENVTIAIVPTEPPALPDAPTGLQATTGDSEVTLSWEASASGSSSITNYKVYRKAASGDYVLVATLGNVTGFTDLQLSNGQTYRYRVSAVSPIGEGAPSAEISATPSASNWGSLALPIAIGILVAVGAACVLVWALRRRS